MKMKKLAFLFVALMLFVSVSACSSPAPAPAPSAPAGAEAPEAQPSEAKPDAEKKNLTLLMYTNADIQAKVIDALIPFEEANNVKVDVILCPIADYEQKMGSMIAGGTPPDVYFVSEMTVPQYYKDGLLADLTDLTKDTDWASDDFVAGQVDHWTYDGKLVGVPFSGAPQAMYYNKTIIQQAGLKTPTELLKAGEWNVDAMLDIARKTSDSDNGIFGISFVRPGEWTPWDVAITPALRLYGGSPWSKDFKTVEINSEASKKGLQTFYDLMFVDKAHPMPGSSVDFLAGQVVMLPTWYNYVKTLIDLPFEWDVVPTPLNEKGGSLGVMGSAGYGVYPEGENLDLAKAMVKFLTSKETIGGPMLNIFFPTRLSAITSDTFRTGNNGEYVHPSSESFDLTLSNDTLSILPVKSAHPEYAKLSQIIQSHLEAVYANAANMSDAADAMAAEMEAFMVK